MEKSLDTSRNTCYLIIIYHQIIIYCMQQVFILFIYQLVISGH